jgi:ribosomal 50S subunit-associated protein YjgA (DUF615 family)
MIDKEKIQKRIQQLKQENDEANNTIVQLEQTRNRIIQEMLVRNGRILELEGILENIEEKE